MTKDELIKNLQDSSIPGDTKVLIPSFYREGEFVLLDYFAVDGLTKNNPKILLYDGC